MSAISSRNCTEGGELDAVAHIQAAARRNLTQLPYADKYKDDFIRKARGVYYCEVCNETLFPTDKVSMHVTEATHVASKTRRQLKRVGTAIVFQENTLLTESAWNGLVDDTCVLCNAEFDDESTHKSQESHISNLMYSSVTASAVNEIYRKIDGGYQCLTCNKIVSGDGITEHFNSEQHKSALIRYNQNQNEANDVKNDDFADKESRDGDTTANTEPSKADGKTLYTSPVLMKDKTKAPCSSDVTEVETVDKNSRDWWYCATGYLDVNLLVSFNECVNGKKHKRNLAKQSQANIQTTKNIKKMSMKDFVLNIIRTRDSVSPAKFVVINDFFFLYYYKFIGLAKRNDKLVCLVCDMDLSQENLDKHLSSPSHINELFNCLVITSLKDEFVREIRRDLYQCGYCGTVENDLDHMLDHLVTDEHRECKAAHFDNMEYFKVMKYSTDMFDSMTPTDTVFQHLLKVIK